MGGTVLKDAKQHVDSSSKEQRGQGAALSYAPFNVKPIILSTFAADGTPVLIIQHVDRVAGLWRQSQYIEHVKQGGNSNTEWQFKDRDAFAFKNGGFGFATLRRRTTRRIDDNRNDIEWSMSYKEDIVIRSGTGIYSPGP